MSSSSPSASCSRSPSPTNPATPDSSDSLETVAFDSNFGLSSWYQSLAQGKLLGTDTLWADGQSQFRDMMREDEGNILSLDELIQDSAYADPSSNIATPDVTAPEQSCDLRSKQSPAASEVPSLQHESPVMIPPSYPVPPTRPIPPPTPQPRVRSSAAMLQTVVFPAKEICSNLPIRIPDIPESGTKSRVETQVRVTVDLAYPSSSSGEQSQYDRVGTWKWLKLPRGTSTKKRTRKEGKIDPAAEDILHLAVEVTCASPPHVRVVCCSSCQTREAKRVARKLAARVRPQRADSDVSDGGAIPNSKTEFSIVQFNCSDVLDFSTGTVILPLRITCYCRHHREKVGFNVHFKMLDHTGRVVGTGTTPPIMITDDHKSATASGNKQLLAHGMSSGLEVDWSQVKPQNAAPEKGKSKRKYTSTTDVSEQSKKRAKAVPSSRGSSAKVSRAGSSGSLCSPPAVTSGLPTRSTSPAQYFISGPPSQFSNTTSPTPQLPDSSEAQRADYFLPSPSSSHVGDHDSGHLETPVLTMAMLNLPRHDTNFAGKHERPDSPLVFLPTAPPSPADISLPRTPISQHPVPPLPFLFFHSDPPASISSLPKPRISRLIPASGPTYGGIEVTILGSNFHPTVQLDCLFGDVLASSTQRWSDNTLVCILPPRISPGVVAVWFNGVQKDEDGTPPCLFTYTDESDRTLMELALQVVGLKMTGKLEDAKSVAMRIVGPAGDDSQGQEANSGNTMQFTSNTMSLDLHPFLHRAGLGGDLEKMVTDLLSLLDICIETQSSVPLSTAMSHQTSSGQTLLHIAVLLKYPKLVTFLIQHLADLDARDRNGYTPLHFAGIVSCTSCAKILIGAGADVAIVNAHGKTAQELATFDFDDLWSDACSADEESQWGDGEEESEDEPALRDFYVRRIKSVRRGVDTPASASSQDEKIDAEKLRDSTPKPSEGLTPGVDEKQAASFISFMDTIQRTLARVQPVQDMIPTIPHLPLPNLPNLPNLPGMPAVPWGALPQIPMVFPVYVPWPAFLGEKRGEQLEEPREGMERALLRGTIRTLWTSQEWRAFWEKWVAHSVQRAQPAQDDEPPPMYTPRAEPESERKVEKVAKLEKPNELEEPKELGELKELENRATVSEGPSMSAPERLGARRVGYDASPVPDLEVKAYAYRPAKKPTRQIQKKEDRMLILFWIPILLIGLVWAFFHGVRLAFQSLRAMAPLKAILRV